MEAGVPAEMVEESARSMLGSARILFRSIWHWIAGFRAPVMAASNEPPAKTGMAETVTVANPKTEVRPEEQINSVIPSALEVARPKTEVHPAGQIESVIPSALEEGEIQRRRNLVRTFFNDFWSGSYEKPAGFVERLDRAEDYVNDRLAAHGEAWRLDSQTRVMLGLPHRVN
jgi:hypothetical protein